MHMKFLLVAVALVAVACQPRTPPEPATPSPAPVPEPPANEDRWASVPQERVGDVECPDEPVPTPSFCDWVTAHDVVARVRIVTSEASYAPAAAALAGGGQEIVDAAECAAMDPALRLRVEFLETYVGDAPAEADVFVGANQTSAWTVLLTSEYPDESLAWEDAAERFQEGTDVILPLFVVEGGYSMWTTIPVVDEAGVLTFPEPACPGQLPFEGDGISDAEFAALAQDCPASTDEAAALRAEWDASNAPRDGAYTTWAAALCYVPLPEQPQCAIDFDCPAETPLCVNGSCSN